MSRKHQRQKLKSQRMLRVKVNGESYGLPLTVSDITIEKHIELSRLEAEMPQKLKDILDEQDTAQRQWKAKRVKKTEYSKEFLPYFGRVISIMSGIPLNLLLGDAQNAGAPVAMLETWYWKVMEAYAKFEPDETVTSFVIEGEEYFLPETHMTASTFGEFAEAAQYEEHSSDVAAGKWESIPKVMAILLKRKGEKYDPQNLDAIVEERAKIFMGAGMDVAYQTAFFLLKRNIELKKDSLIYTVARTIATHRRELTN